MALKMVLPLWFRNTVKELNFNPADCKELNGRVKI